MQWKISERGIARRVLKPELLVVLSAINENESLLKMRESETLIAWIFKCFAKSRQNIESHRWERWFIRALTSSSNIFLRCVYYVISINILLSRLVSKTISNLHLLMAVAEITPSNIKNANIYQQSTDVISFIERKKKRKA